MLSEETNVQSIKTKIAITDMRLLQIKCKEYHPIIVTLMIGMEEM